MAAAEPSRSADPLARFPGIVAALTGATLGFAFGEAVASARASDAFLVAPSLARIGAYLCGLLLFSGLALAFEIGGPPLAARGGRAARQVRATIRRRLRHGRSRADIAKVESGLTVSACLVLTALGLAFATAKTILVVLIAAALVAALIGLLALCRLAGYVTRRCCAIGLLYGFAAGCILS